MSREVSPSRAEGATQHVCFLLGGDEYAVEIRHVQEIIRMQPVTRVPGTPDFVEGVVDLRGRVIPVLDLRRRFGLGPAGDPARMRVIVAAVGGRLLGLVVDGVREVLALPRAQVEPPPPEVTGSGREYLAGIGRRAGRLILLLDLERLLSADEAKRLAEA